MRAALHPVAREHDRGTGVSAKTWGGREVTKARAHWASRLPVPCCRCHRPVLSTDSWQVDHWPIPREFGGTETWPAHSLCNLSSGGKRGAEITNARRAVVATPTQRMTPERDRRIRGR